MRRVCALRSVTLIAALVAGVLAAGFAGCGRRGSEEAAAPTEETVTATPVMVTTAMRGSIEEILEVTGTAQADEEVDVVSEVSGKVARVYADVGDYVRRGQTLVRIDSQIAAAQADQAASGVTSAKATLSQAQEALRLTEATTASAVRSALVAVDAARERLRQAQVSAQLTESQVNSNIEQARTALESAQTQLAEVRAGARAQQRRQAEAQVQQAKANLDLAEQNDARYKSLLDSGVIPQQQYDQIHTQYLVARAAYDQALEALSLVEEGARTEQVRLAELAVQQAEEQLRLAEAGRAQIEVARQEVAAAEQALRQAEEQVRAAEASRRQVELRKRDVAAAEAGVRAAEAGRRVATVQLTKHTVAAPISGLVARRNVDPGEGALPGSPLLRLVDIDPIRIDAVVSELDVDRVHAGDQAVVTFDGLGDQQFLARVTEIAPQSNQGSRNYTARIEVDNRDGAIRPGMFARIQIVLAAEPEAVLVTRDAIVESGAQRLVYAVVNGKIEVREVALGASRGNLVQVLEGVRAGDILVATGQDQLADGQAVTPRDRAEAVVDGEGEAGSSTDGVADPNGEPAPPPANATPSGRN